MLDRKLTMSVVSPCAALLLAVGAAGPATASPEATATGGGGANAPTQSQERQIRKIESMSDAELREHGKQQAAKYDAEAAPPRTAAQSDTVTAAGWPSHTFSRKTTVRMFNAVKGGGVAAVAGICAAVTPTGPIGRAIAAGGCTAIGGFLASVSTLPKGKCVNINMRLAVRFKDC